jgi:Uma2 family endonuclease
MLSVAVDVLPRYRFTVRDYHRMGEAGILHEDSHVELIEGEIVIMSPIGSVHVAVVNRLVRLFDRAVGDLAIVSVQNPVILDDHSEPEPDLVLLRPRDDFYESMLPGPDDVLLIVEVADTSLRYDREVKIPLYARHRIAEVWLVDVENRRVTSFSSPFEEGYQQEKVQDNLTSISPLCLPDITLDLSQLFRR